MKRVAWSIRDLCAAFDSLVMAHNNTHRLTGVKVNGVSGKDEAEDACPILLSGF
jgi:hypothetical protein